MTDNHDHPGRFRKRPVEITAIQWTGDNADAVKAFTGPNKGWFVLPGETATAWDAPHVWDNVQSTWVQVNPGDWIIKGVKGEFYPCADDVFRATYEAVTPWLRFRYRGQRTDVEAIQWIGSNVADVKAFVGTQVDGDEPGFLLPEETTGAWKTPHVWDPMEQDWQSVNTGDWIIRDRIGFHVWADAGFRKFYDAVTP